MIECLQIVAADVMILKYVDVGLYFTGDNLVLYIKITNV